MWRPATLAETIAAGLDVSEWPTRQPRGAPEVRYRCPCGAHVQPARLIDCRSLPIEQDWACDGCWTRWCREGVIFDDGEPIPDRREWQRRWLKAHGAPDDVVAKVTLSRPVEPYKKRRHV